MDHIAIMKKDWKLIPKIKNGTKIIESRWYLHKVAPWGKIKPNETIYFKNSGEPVTLSAKVVKVLSFENLSPIRVQELLNEYGKEDGIEEKDIPIFYERFKDKKYCLLIYLKEVKEVEPFNIDKTGFGSMSAWISVENVMRIKL
jgi:ASC-1-like (ASCH) protein